MFLILLFGAFLALGLFLVLANVLKIPTIATGKAIQSTRTRGNIKVSGVDVIVSNLSLRVMKFIKLNEFKKIRLQNTLKAVEIVQSPEEYTARCFVKGSFAFVLVIPSFFVFPLLAPIFLLLGVLIYFKEYNKITELLSEKRKKIETELPRFVRTITQELQHNRDILAIIDHFKRSTTAEFAKELDILSADMRSGGYENALTRFEARFNSPLLSDIVRGLITVLRGDDGVIYFRMLSHDMKQLELQKLKADALKVPPKIRRYSLILLMCFLMTYLVVIGYEIVRSFQTLF